jgi:hypothetical protein
MIPYSTDALISLSSNIQLREENYTIFLLCKMHGYERKHGNSTTAPRYPMGDGAAVIKRLPESLFSIHHQINRAKKVDVLLPRDASTEEAQQ